MWYEPARPFLPSEQLPPTAEQGARRKPDLLDITDVIGKRVVETGHHGRVTVGEDNAAADLDVSELLARTRSREANAVAFAQAYRRYCWPTDGLSGVQLSPFQMLASEAATHHGRDHGWHLGMADRLADADPMLIRHSQRIEVDTTDPDSVAAAIDSWLEPTAAGGEGMVVKPYDNLTRGRRGLVQPGRQGPRQGVSPHHLRPRVHRAGHLERRRQRGLGRKRSLALREYALRLEALERVARGEPLWRVLEAVFAVLALESEPIDPRL